MENNNPITASTPTDTATGANYAAELEQLRKERDAAVAKANDLENEKRLHQARSAFGKAWRQEGLIDNPEARKLFAGLVKLDPESGRAVVVEGGETKRDAAGNHVSVAQYVRDLANAMPSLRGQSGSGSRASTPSFTGRPRYKSDFGHGVAAAQRKAEYISQHGLTDWEALPAAPPSSPSTGKPQTFRG